jgi:hypothetical protein
MVKTYIGQWLYTFPWSQVVSGYWQKFPNPYTYDLLFIFLLSKIYFILEDMCYLKIPIIEQSLTIKS